MATAREPINRPDTYQRLPIPPPHLRSAAGSLIAASTFSNRSFRVKRICVVLPGSRFSPRSAAAAASSGPAGSAGIARSTTGLRSNHVPPAARAIACTRAQGQRSRLKKLRTSFDCYAAACGAQRNGSPVRHTLCRITDNFRAKATRALPEPDRRSIADAQSFRCSDRLTR